MEFLLLIIGGALSGAGLLAYGIYAVKRNIAEKLAEKRRRLYAIEQEKELLEIAQQFAKDRWDMSLETAYNLAEVGKFKQDEPENWDDLALLRSFQERWPLEKSRLLLKTTEMSALLAQRQQAQRELKRQTIKEGIERRRTTEITTSFYDISTGNQVEWDKRQKCWVNADSRSIPPADVRARSHYADETPTVHVDVPAHPDLFQPSPPSRPFREPKMDYDYY